MDFDLKMHQAGARPVLSVGGDLDVLTAPQLRDRLIELIEGGHLDFLVDLGPTEFVDSSGLSALVTAVKRVRALGGDIGIVCPAGNVRRLIEITALDQVFTLYSSADAVPEAGG